MQRRFLLVTLAASALAAAGCSGDKPQFKSVDITGSEFGRDFRMQDQDGRLRSLADFRGQAVVLFFGFTQCPDVCPTTLAEIVQARQLLGADGAKVQAVFVTVDPERDTPQVLKAYLANFDPGFVGLRGSAEELEALAREFKVYYKKVEGKTPGSYTMDHSAASYVYDPQGRLRLYARYGIGAQALADDLRLLLQGA